MSAVILNSKSEAETWARALTQEFRRPCVVLLSGGLGAGKTQFTRWFLEELGVTGTMSPTFAIHQRHESHTGSVDHVDLYRLTSDDDLESSGFWDLLTPADSLLIVEWADRLPDSVWPKNWKRISVRLEKGASEESRHVYLEIQPAGS